MIISFGEVGHYYMLDYLQQTLNAVDREPDLKENWDIQDFVESGILVNWCNAYPRIFFPDTPQNYLALAVNKLAMNTINDMVLEMLKHSQRRLCLGRCFELHSAAKPEAISLHFDSVLSSLSRMVTRSISNHLFSLELPFIGKLFI